MSNTATLITELADDGSAAADRMAALKQLQAVSMQGDRFQPHQADYRAALRSSLDAEDMKLRLRVIETLVAQKDRETQKRLIEGLEDPSKELCSPEKALQFLSYDIHAGVFPIAREKAENPPSDEAQHEALRILGADPEAADIFAEILEDPDEDTKARSISATCLRSLDPERFVEVAKAVAADAGGDEEIRTQVLVGLVQTETDPEDDDLKALAESIAEEEDANDSVKRSAKRILAKTPGTPEEEEEEEGAEAEASGDGEAEAAEGESGE